jgi:hypothetical protein
MAIIYVGHGKTGSGKTELANYLERKYSVHHYHPIGFMKRFEEKLCGLPEGALDAIEGKSQPVPTNEDKTMQEYMVALYHFYKTWMPGRSSLNMRLELPKILAYSNVCLVSLRNLQEVDALIDIKDAGHHRLITFSLHRETSVEETSDENYCAIRDKLWTHSDMMFPVNNNFSLNYLHQIIDDILRYAN